MNSNNKTSASSSSPASLANRQKGSVIIIVLWTSVLLTVLVTAMASKVRLSAKTAVHNQEAAIDWVNINSAINQAEMELMLERMPVPIGEQREEDAEGQIREPAYRFNGQALQLNYPLPENMVVRIYDHGGKINLNRIPRNNMQSLIENRLGGVEADPEEVQELLAAWTDWIDLNDLESLNGAEEEYYLDLEQPYLPRNNPELESVEEILHVRGFAELWEGVNLEAAFTIYGNSRTVNLNVATREAMQLLPGLNDEIIEYIIANREIRDFDNMGEWAEIIPFENLAELSNWIGWAPSTIYSIFAYPKISVEEATGQLEDEGFDPDLPQADPVQQAYMEIVEVRSYSTLPRIYEIDPYARLPDTAAARIQLDEFSASSLLNQNSQNRNP